MCIRDRARQIGKEIQKDERYLNLQKAEKTSDADEQLQQLIGEFNLKRMAINNEAQKEDRDEDKLQKFNLELRDCYSSIMENPNMIAYQMAKQEMDTLLKSCLLYTSFLGRCIIG